MKAGETWIQYLLALVPDGEWQHITFTVPCEFWPLIYHNRWLLAEMSRLAADVVLETGRRGGFLQPDEVCATPCACQPHAA